MTKASEVTIKSVIHLNLFSNENFFCLFTVANLDENCYGRLFENKNKDKGMKRAWFWKVSNFTMSSTKLLTAMRHALECKNPGCRVKNCHKTKRLLNHSRQCKTILCARCRIVHKYRDTQFPTNWIYKQKIPKCEFIVYLQNPLFDRHTDWLNIERLNPTNS